MNRRQFIRTGAAGLSAAALGFSGQAGGSKPLRVGLIGSGWYGKCDLMRLIQVAPVEVVSLCDVDKRMLAEAAELMSVRQSSHKKPRTFSDYRPMLAEKDMDIVLVATPDHWHALPMIAAVKSGAHVYCQKPISVDVVEGQAMLAAARKYNRVVQIGTQRRSTPHLIEARDRIVREGKLGKIGVVEIYCYYPMRDGSNPPDTAPPDYLDYEMWTGPAPMRPYNRIVHPRGWRAFMEYGNGILGDMCVHMLDMTRWMMDLGWPKRVESSGGILVAKNTKANITDTQLATFDYGDVKVIWQHRSWGSEPDPKYAWGATFYGDKGTLKASVYSYDFTPMGQGGSPIHKDVAYELEQFPEDKTEKDLEKHCAPAIRGHMKDMLHAISTGGRPVADIEQGHISTASCILANVALKLGRTLTWDEKAGRVVGDEEANRLLMRPYRNPWGPPYAGKRVKDRTAKLLLVGYAALFAWAAVSPYDRATWYAENIPIVLIAIALIALYLRGFVFSPAAYVLMSVLLYMHTIGGHYTFERVPFGFVTNLFGFERNHYDRVAHFSVGFYAYAIAEALVRTKAVRSRLVLFLFPIFTIAFVAMGYELIEWWYAAAAGGQSGAAFLGSQGDIWDAQKDMLADTLGAIAAMALFTAIRPSERLQSPA